MKKISGTLDVPFYRSLILIISCFVSCFVFIQGVLYMYVIILSRKVITILRAIPDARTNIGKNNWVYPKDV